MWKYRGFFALLYFIQGASLAYVINFQKPYLAGHGIAKETLGLFTAVLLIPFILKIFIGMLSDRVPLGRLGSRKPYMALGLGLFAVAYLALSQVNPGADFPLFAGLAWLGALGLATFDTCADGWAVDIAEEQEQSAIQAAMISGKSMGLILMSFGFGVVAERSGFGLVFQTLAILSFLVLVVVMFVPYRPRPRVTESLVKDWGDLLKVFYVLFAIFGVVYSIASFGTDGLLTLHLTDVHHASNRDLGFFGVCRGIGALIGAALYVLSFRRMGIRNAQFVALLALGCGCLIPLMNLSLPATGILWGMCWGFQETAFVTLAMRFAEGAWAASFFAMSMIFSNLGTSLGEMLAAPLVPRFGYNAVFVAFALVAWSCLFFVPKMMQPVHSEAI